MTKRSEGHRRLFMVVLGLWTLYVLAAGLAGLSTGWELMAGEAFAGIMTLGGVWAGGVAVAYVVRWTWRWVREGFAADKG